MQVVEVNIAAKTTSCETQVVFEPIDASNALDMALKDHRWRTLSSVKVEHKDGILVSDTSKHMATVWEFYLCAAFDWVRLEHDNRLRQNIAHLDFILHGDNQVQSWRVESDR